MRPEAKFEQDQTVQHLGELLVSGDRADACEPICPVARLCALMGRVLQTPLFLLLLLLLILLLKLLLLLPAAPLSLARGLAADERAPFLAQLDALRIAHAKSLAPRVSSSRLAVGLLVRGFPQGMAASQQLIRS